MNNIENEYCEYFLNGKEVEVNVRYSYGDWGRSYKTLHPDELSAKLHYDSLIKAKKESIEAFAKNMYMAGYRDGRAKKAKSQWMPNRTTYRFDVKY